MDRVQFIQTQRDRRIYLNKQYNKISNLRIYLNKFYNNLLPLRFEVFIFPRVQPFTKKTSIVSYYSCESIYTENRKGPKKRKKKSQRWWIFWQWHAFWLRGLWWWWAAPPIVRRHSHRQGPPAPPKWRIAPLWYIIWLTAWHSWAWVAPKRRRRIRVVRVSRLCWKLMLIAFVMP